MRDLSSNVFQRLCGPCAEPVRYPCSKPCEGLPRPAKAARQPRDGRREPRDRCRGYRHRGPVTTYACTFGSAASCARVNFTRSQPSREYSRVWSPEWRDVGSLDSE